MPGALSPFLLAVAPLFLAAATPAEPTAAPPVDPAATSHREWQVWHGDVGGTHYSELDQIDTSNVGRLEVAWTYNCGDRGNTIECNPIVVDGVLYATTPSLHCIALDAATGELVWRWPGGGGGGVNRGLNYWSDGAGDRRIFYARGSYLYALDAGSGVPVHAFGAGGRIDLRLGVDRDATSISVGNRTPGVIYRDLLILGSAVGEGPGPSAPGHIRAFDVRTGERRWIFHTIPHPGEFGYETWSPDSWRTSGGANAWGGLTLDPARGLVFCGTGSPSYDHWGGDRIGQNLFGNCVLALDAATGERAWHFQVVHHDLWDYDLPTPPVMVEVEHDGERVAAVAQATKMGHLFILDRETGEPLHPVEEVPVPASEMPGEKSWPTQPFPPPGLRYAQQRLTAAEATDLNPAAKKKVRAELAEMVTGDIFIPPGFKRSVVLPQFNGGAEWGGPAYDPATRTLFVNASDEAEWISMVPAKPRGEITLGELGNHVYRSLCANCHGYGSEPVVPGSPALKDVAARLDRDEVRALLKTGRGQMPPFIGGEVETRAVMAYLYGDTSTERVKTADLKLGFAGGAPVVSTGHHDWRDPEGFPVNRRPWGTLSAIDLDRQEIRWQVPLGTYPELEKRGLPPTGTFNIGGPLVTRGGLVFIGAARDERFHAFDAATGKLLWETQLPAGGYATPATYELGGRQYIVIAAGGGGKAGTKRGDAYVCFALPRG